MLANLIPNLGQIISGTKCARDQLICSTEGRSQNVKKVGQLLGSALPPSNMIIFNSLHFAKLNNSCIIFRYPCNTDAMQVLCLHYTKYIYAMLI